MSKQFTETDAIRNIQTYLRRLSYLDDDTIDPPIDGVFDTRTENALRQFQRNNDLAVTGRADRETWDTLYAQYLLELERISLPDPIIPFPSYPSDFTLSLGDESFLVAIIQYMLQELSVFYDIFTDISLSGIYDAATEKAIAELQRANMLEVTGKVDKKTWNSLSRFYNLSLHYIDQK